MKIKHSQEAMMPTSSQQRESGGDSADNKTVEQRRLRLRLPVVGEVILPPARRLAYFVGLGTLAAIDLIEWPIALVIVAGQVLSEKHVARVARGIGEAVGEA
jgi:hypothetical protein